MPKSGEAAVLPVPKFFLQAGPSFACEPLLERAMAAPGAPDTPHVYRLTESKRFGAPLAAYLACAHPDLCAALAASPSLGETTPVAHVWHKAPCHSWYSLGYFLDSARKSHVRGTAARQLSAAAWNDGLFSRLAACALTLLQKEARRRRELAIGFAQGELVAVVCAGHPPCRGPSPRGLGRVAA